EAAVLISAPGVRFALIPDHALDRVWRKRREHSVVQPRRHPRFAGRARRRRVFGLRLLGAFLVFRQLSFVPLHSLRIIGGELLVFGVVVENAGARPRFGGRAADGVVDQSDGHVARLVQVASEVIADGGKRRGGLRRTLFPYGLHVGQWRVNFRARRGEE